MEIVVRASEAQQQEWLQQPVLPGNVRFVRTAAELQQAPAAAYIDLLFDAAHPVSLPPQAFVLVNSVVETCSQLPFHYARINAWPGFLGRPVAEIAVYDEAGKTQAAQWMQNLSWPCELVADVPGMVTARTVAMIINEAYFALVEGVSTRQEMDTAMKLGTHYPYGPFEWAEQIGLREVHRLLQQLSATHALYTPAPALTAAVQALND